MKHSKYYKKITEFTSGIGSSDKFYRDLVSNSIQGGVNSGRYDIHFGDMGEIARIDAEITPEHRSAGQVKVVIYEPQWPPYNRSNPEFAELAETLIILMPFNKEGLQFEIACALRDGGYMVNEFERNSIAPIGRSLENRESVPKNIVVVTEANTYQEDWPKLVEVAEEKSVSVSLALWGSEDDRTISRLLRLVKEDVDPTEDKPRVIKITCGRSVMGRLHDTWHGSTEHILMVVLSKLHNAEFPDSPCSTDHVKQGLKMTGPLELTVTGEAVAAMDRIMKAEPGRFKSHWHLLSYAIRQHLLNRVGVGSGSSGVEMGKTGGLLDEPLGSVYGPGPDLSAFGPYG